MTNQSTQVTLHVSIVAKPESNEELKGLLLDLLAPTRLEAGCLNYDLHEDPSDACRFMFYENWQSQADLDKHAASAHIVQFFQAAEPLLAQPIEITSWQMIG